MMLADGDPNKMDGLKKLTVEQYLIFLDIKMRERKQKETEDGG